MPDDDEPMMGGGGMGGMMGEESESEPVDEFETEARAAFPEKEWAPEQVAAFKEAIRLCLKEDQAGGYDKPPPKKGGVDGLALVFEGPKKKGG